MRDKVALITGGSGNIGQKFSSLLKEKKFKIIILDIKKPKSNFDFFFKVDLNKLKNVEKISKKISKKYTKIDILINCAAMVGTNKSPGWNTVFQNQNLKSWNNCLNVNLTSVFVITRNLLKNMSKAKNPKIINISSIYGSCAPRKEIYSNTKINSILAYSVSKAGLEIMTKWLSATLDKKFSVNSIAFGGLFSNQEKNFVKKYSNFTFKKRMMNINDVEPVLKYLTDENQNYVTGQNLYVDGGWSVF